jgi:HTH-type transcriptional regulator/antitoxin HipB
LKKFVTNASELGSFIQEERHILGITQAELAELANVSVPFLSHVENGKETAQIGKVFRVLEQLGCGMLVVGRGARQFPE